MKSALPPDIPAALSGLPAAPGLYRLCSAGVASPLPIGSTPGAGWLPTATTAPTPPPAPRGPTDLLVELGPCAAAPGREFPYPPRREIRILASGTPRQLDAHPAAPASTPFDLSHAVLMPGMVNAHTHLDLTHLGPLEHDPDAGFVAWVDRVREGRARTPEAIAASVRRGIDLSLRAGVVLVGDIAGAAAGEPRLEPFEALAGSQLFGVSFVEFFAIGTREAASLERLEAVLGRAAREGIVGDGLGYARLGLQPHAPNTVSVPAYRRAIGLARRFGLPLATHLAETLEEREFIAHASGPQRAMLERLGVWEDSLLDHRGGGRRGGGGGGGGGVGKGDSPIAHLAPVLDEAARVATPFVVAHVNDTGPDTAQSLEILKRSGTSVAYCPRASAYFGAPARLGPHRYREMLAAGVNVCLGTDSILNLPRGVEEATGPGLSVLDEARLLFARDHADAETLLAMMTANGCTALGWNESACSLAPGAFPLGLVAVEVADTPADFPAIERVLRAHSQPTLLALAAGSDAH